MFEKRAVITGIAAELPEHILSNDELSQMVDTSDEWTMTRITCFLQMQPLFHINPA